MYVHNDKLLRLYALAQAGLLHDIGKLYQRGGDRDWKSAKFLGDKPESYMNVCPTRPDGGYSHQHVAWSVAFCERHENALPVKLVETFSDPQESVNSLIADHHQGSYGRFPFQRILQIADGCAAGMERKQSEEDLHFKKTPLRTIWSALSGGKTVYACRIKPLNAGDESAFPIEFRVSDERHLEFRELCGKLEAAMEALTRKPPASKELKLAALDDILYRHTWCVPSAVYKTDPEVSLYAHSLATAAIAVALGAELMDDNGTLNKSDIEDKEAPRLRFAVIDLAGIQNYIYDMDQSGFKGTAKVLRGRSFYVSAILEAVELALLERLGLPRVVTLLDGGGKLVMLLPAKSAEVCRKFSGELEQALVEATHGRLRIHIGVGEPFGWGKFASMEGSHAAIKKPHDSAFEALDRAKFQPLKLYLSKSLIDEVFESESGACRACGKMPGKVPIEKENLEVGYYCRNCHEQRELGAKLVAAVGFEFSRSCGFELPVPYRSGRVHIKIHTSASALTPTSDKLSIHSLADQTSVPGIPVRHLANYVHRSGEEVTDFEKLSELGEGVAHLCAVAGDVDNLGDLFKDIWKDPKGCLANLMTASRLLNHFFAGEMEHTLQNSLVYTVYAGGDDFFYIGKWNEVLKNISQWRKRFRDFIGLEKPSFSAGLYICHHHTPIHRMHEAAEEQLNRAKGKELCAKADYIEPPVDADCKPLKDRVALWGKVMRWEEDWKEVVAEMEQLDKWLKSEDKDHKPFNSAFYYRLLGYARRAEATRNGSCELEDWMFVPHLRYDLGRNVRDKAPDADFQHFYDLANLKEDNKTEFFKTLYRVPLMWALYLNRN